MAVSRGFVSGLLGVEDGLGFSAGTVVKPSCWRVMRDAQAKDKCKRIQIRLKSFCMDQKETIQGRRCWTNQGAAAARI